MSLVAKLNQAVQRSYQRPSLPLFDPCTLPFFLRRLGGGSLIHIFVWGQGTVGAFSFLSTSCPWLCSELALPSTSSPHHCVPRHRDDMQHVPWLPEREGSHHLFSLSLSLSPATSFVSWLFNFPVPCFLSAHDAQHPYPVWICGGWMHHMRWSTWQIEICRHYSLRSVTG